MLDSFYLNQSVTETPLLGGSGGAVDGVIDETSVFGNAKIYVKIIIGSSECYALNSINGDRLYFNKPQQIAIIYRNAGSMYKLVIEDADATTSVKISIK